MFNFKEMLGQAKSMQKKMEEAKKELETKVFEGESAAGWVCIQMNGKLEVLSVKIDPDVLKEEKIMLEECVCSALNQCLTQFKHYEKDHNPMSNLSNLSNFKDMFS